MIELPRSLTPADAAAGILNEPATSLADRIERGFRGRLSALPEPSRRLLLLASAEPLGDRDLLLKAASRFDCSIDAAGAAEDAGFFELHERLSFRHPLARSAVYQSATQDDRRSAHEALAEATDANLDPDRRAWHHALAALGPNEVLASELETTAVRARARGGLAAAGAFLERAAVLTPDSPRRAERTLAAAEMMLRSGGLDATERLLQAADRSQYNETQNLRAERLQAQLLMMRSSGTNESSGALLGAAQRLRHLDPPLARDCLLHAFNEAFNSTPESLALVVEELKTWPLSDSTDAVELMLVGWMKMTQDGFPAGTEQLRAAMIALRDKPRIDVADLAIIEYAFGVVRSLWDFESWDGLARHCVQIARDAGAFFSLPLLLGSLANINVSAGEFDSAAVAFAEAEAICEATGVTIVGRSPWLEAWRCETAEALTRIAANESRATQPHYDFENARCLAFLGAGQYGLALAAAQRGNDLHPLGGQGFNLPDFIEAASRHGEIERARDALGRLVERTQIASTDWALGVEARSAALLTDDLDDAETLYRQAVERLRIARARPDLGRTRICCMASGYAARDDAWTRENNCTMRTTSLPASAHLHLQNEPYVNSPRAVRPPGSGLMRHGRISRRRKETSRALLATASQTPKSGGSSS